MKEINTSYHVILKKCNKLCSALDIIEDTTLAIKSFQSCEWTTKAIGMKYLLIYGLLQALFVQQDALVFGIFHPSGYR